VVGRVPEVHVPAPVECEIDPSNVSPEHGENAEKE